MAHAFFARGSGIRSAAFTPALTSTDAVIAPQTVVARYSRLGSRVFFNVYFLLTNDVSGTMTNQVSITGLPFTSRNIANVYVACSIGDLYGVDWPANAKQLFAHIPPNSTRIDLYWAMDDGAAEPLKAQDLDGAVVALAISGSYELQP